MSNKQRYKLLTDTLVGAISTSDVGIKGTVWQPGNEFEQNEANSLVAIGYAELTDDKTTHDVRSKTGDGTNPIPISGVSEAILQPDGTYVNGNGLRVNQDGSLYTGEDGQAQVGQGQGGQGQLSAEDQQIVAFLGNKAEDVIASLANVTEEQRPMLARMAELEADKANGGKGRSTVLAAITKAQEPAA